MKRFLILSLAVVAVVASPVGTLAVASPTFRMSIVHRVHGCHAWWRNGDRAASTTIKVKRGTRVQIRISCPMDYEFRQVRGPRLALGNPRTATGTVRTIVFRKPGRYVLTARNIQSSEEMGLPTLGPDNLLRLTVVVS